MEELTSVTFKADLREFMINGTKTLVGIVEGGALINISIPNNPNSREYMDRKNKFVPESKGLD